MKNVLCLSICLVVIGYGQPPRGGMMDNKKAQMIKKWKLIEYLDLNEEQSEKFFVRVNKFQKEMKTIHKKGKTLREEIHALLEDDKIKANKVKDLVDEYIDIQSEVLELRRNHHKDVGDILTPEQTVKYVLFDQTFKKRMKDQLFNKRGHHGVGPPP